MRPWNMIKERKEEFFICTDSGLVLMYDFMEDKYKQYGSVKEANEYVKRMIDEGRYLAVLSQETTIEEAKRFTALIEQERADAIARIEAERKRKRELENSSSFASSDSESDEEPDAKKIKT